MAASGLLAILDDISAMLDGGSGIEEIGVEKATKLAHGGIIDDVRRAHEERISLDHKHEMAVVMAVAKGALKNKVLYFIPTTFAIAAFAPWAVMPLCIASGAYIAYEGVKRLEARKNPHAHAQHQEELMRARMNGKETLLRYEKEKIAQAIKTDAALSLELTGFQVGMTAGAPLAAKLAVISAISIGATVALYATVIGIIGMNQVAQTLSLRKGEGRGARIKRGIGRTLSGISSPMMKGIAVVGMGALFFVGGHLLSAYIPGVSGLLAGAGNAVAGAGPWIAGAVTTAATIVTGLVGGVVSYTGAKIVQSAHRFMKRREDAVYSRATKKMKNAVSVRTLCKAFSKVFSVDCGKAAEEEDLIVIDDKRPSQSSPQSSEAGSLLTEAFSGAAEKDTPVAPSKAARRHVRRPRVSARRPGHIRPRRVKPPRGPARKGPGQ